MVVNLHNFTPSFVGDLIGDTSFIEKIRRLSTGAFLRLDADARATPGSTVGGVLHGITFGNLWLCIITFNHVGHALLFYLLRPHLADDARIVITSSGTHDPAVTVGMPHPIYTSAELLAHPSAETAKYDGRQRYSTSKLCNMLWMYALHKRIVGASGKKWTVVAFDPGLMPGTGLAREYPPVLRWLWNHLLPHMMPLLRILIGSPNIHSAAESGKALAIVATGERLQGTNGVYFEGTKQIESSVDSHDEKKQEDLWNWTLKFVAKDEQELHSFESF